jgi:hypothetical protein
MMFGPNDGGIKRGDSERTGEEPAGQTNGVGIHGSGVPGGGATGNVTATADSLAEPVSGTWVDSRDAQDALEGFEVADADDPMLGLTAIGGGPARDEQEVEEVERPPEPGDE